MTRAFVGGALANRAGNGGGASVRMTWVEGLRRLGFEVWFVEQIRRERLGEGRGDAGASSSARYFAEVTRACGQGQRAALLDEDGRTILGPDRGTLADAADGALLVNLGGHLEASWLLDRFGCRVFVDLDPGYTQFWSASGDAVPSLRRHDHFFSVGLSLGGSACEIPTNGIPWQPLPPPVVLDEWRVEPGGRRGFTTVASWRGAFGGIEHGGRRFGAKAHQFRRFAELPTRVSTPMEIALDIHPGDERDRRALCGKGWRLVDPRSVAATPQAYRRYVSGSGAEFSAAQGVYVETGSGWISDRTVRYLAAGRPALVQETGLSRSYPTGRGLIAFSSLDEAVAGVESIERDYDEHRRWARHLAEVHFDSDRVLGRMLERAEASP